MRDRLLRIFVGLLALFALAHVQSSAHAYSLYEQALKSWIRQYIPGNKPEFVRPYVANKSVKVYTHGGHRAIDGNRERLESAGLTRRIVSVKGDGAPPRIPRSMAASYRGSKNQSR